MSNRDSYLLALIGLFIFAGVITEKGVSASWPTTDCRFDHYIRCEDFSFDAEQNRFIANITSGSGHEVVVSDFRLWSREEGIVECWYRGREITLPLHELRERGFSEKRELIMECTPFEKVDVEEGDFLLNYSYFLVNWSDAPERGGGTVFFGPPRRQVHYPSRNEFLLGGFFILSLALLAYMLQLKVLVRQTGSGQRNISGLRAGPTGLFTIPLLFVIGLGLSAQDISSLRYAGVALLIFVVAQPFVYVFLRRVFRSTLAASLRYISALGITGLIFMALAYFAIILFASYGGVVTTFMGLLTAVAYLAIIQGGLRKGYWRKDFLATVKGGFPTLEAGLSILFLILIFTNPLEKSSIIEGFVFLTLFSLLVSIVLGVLVAIGAEAVNQSNSPD